MQSPVLFSPFPPQCRKNDKTRQSWSDSSSAKGCVCSIREQSEVIFRWRKVWKVSTKDERKYEKAMIAQTWSVDRRWHKKHNKQKNGSGKWEKDARNMGGRKEKETSSYWARKSRKRQDWAHPQRSPSPIWLFCHQKVNMPSATELDTLRVTSHIFSSSTPTVHTQRACPAELNSLEDSGEPCHSLLWRTNASKHRLW